MDRSEALDGRSTAGATPGLALIFGAGRPAAVCVALDREGVELGREHPIFAAHLDPRISRHHAHVRHEGQRCIVTDRGSRNGLAVDGSQLASGGSCEVTRLLRLGDSLLIPLRDVGPLRRHGVRIADGRVEGPALQAALLAAQRAARSGATLHITGESGAGKEGLARAFHAAGPTAKGPLQAVNCATIPEGVAERLLFGTRRGAYSGADADADGYVQAAHGGTLFLDEIAELSLSVQAKLLRVLETGEVLPLGASRPRKVDLRLCSATHAALRAQVSAGKFREDLYYRIATPHVTVPPLRARAEEIPWLLQLAVAATSGLAVHVSLVEAAALRPWPGNIRELLSEVRDAARTAEADGSGRVEARHLAVEAGSLLSSLPGSSGPASTAAAEPAPPPPRAPEAPPTRAHLVGLLSRVHGNISAAARELGVHRTQLRRWLTRHGIDAASFAPTDAPPEPDES
jgi:DNA-binding NtrC family response regulator